MQSSRTSSPCRTLALAAGALAFPLLAGTAQAAVSCSYDPATHTATITSDLLDLRVTTLPNPDGTIGFAAGGKAPGGDEGADCSGAGTSNTDRIVIHGSSRSLIISTFGGSFAPGFTPEPTGQSEIELAVDGFAKVLLDDQGAS